MPTPSVFVSYRREDAAGHAGRLVDRLVGRYGKERVFFDVDTIDPGEDFARRIEDRIERSDAVLVVIGPRWLDGDVGRARLHHDDDIVRKEVARALTSDCLVIPVLVGGASIPEPGELPDDVRALTTRNAIVIDDRDFHTSVDRLMRTIRSRRAPDEIRDGLYLATTIAFGTVLISAATSARYAVQDLLDGPPIPGYVVWAMLLLIASGVGLYALARGRLLVARVAGVIVAVSFILQMGDATIGDVAGTPRGSVVVVIQLRVLILSAAIYLMPGLLLLLGPDRGRRRAQPPAGVAIVLGSLALGLPLALLEDQGPLTSSIGALVPIVAASVAWWVRNSRWPGLGLGLVVGWAPMVGLVLVSWAPEQGFWAFGWQGFARWMAALVWGVDVAVVQWRRARVRPAPSR